MTRNLKKTKPSKDELYHFTHTDNFEDFSETAFIDNTDNSEVKNLAKSTEVTPGNILSLQRTIGNRAVTRLLAEQPAKTSSSPSSQATKATTIQRLLNYQAAPTTQLGTSTKEGNTIASQINIKQGDLVTLRSTTLADVDIIYRASSVGNKLVLDRYQGNIGSGQIEIANNKTRPGYYVHGGDKAIINAPRTGFDSTALFTDVPKNTTIGQNWENAYNRSLTVNTASGDNQTHAMNSLTLFHITLNSAKKVESHITINTDTLKFLLDSRRHTPKAFAQRLIFLQAVNFQAYSEAGKQEGNLLTVGGDNHWNAFNDQFGEGKNLEMAKKAPWTQKNYSGAKGAGTNIKKIFEQDMLSPQLMPTGYSNLSNIHFRVTPAKYSEVGGGSNNVANYSIDTHFPFTTVMNELEAGLDEVEPGLGAKVVTNSRNQLDAQIEDDQLPANSYDQYYLVMADLPQYREISEMLKALGAKTAMLD